LAHLLHTAPMDVPLTWPSHCVVGHGCAKKHRDDGASATAATCFSCPRSLATPSHRCPPRCLAAPARRRWVHHVCRALTAPSLAHLPRPLQCHAAERQGRVRSSRGRRLAAIVARPRLRLPHEIGRLRPACLMRTRGQWFQALVTWRSNSKGLMLIAHATTHTVGTAN
jgi:hypothetical protein